MKYELNELLRALGERNCGVEGEAATFLGLQGKEKKHICAEINVCFPASKIPVIHNVVICGIS